MKKKDGITRTKLVHTRYHADPIGLPFVSSSWATSAWVNNNTQDDQETLIAKLLCARMYEDLDDGLNKVSHHSGPLFAQIGVPIF